MTEHFDPYHKWLGISPQNQPPDLYRLLALERFEEDLEVIEAAANRQMTYVQSCATGPYVEHSQKLLNEIAAARLCLLDAPRKAQYDAALRDKITVLGDRIAGSQRAPRPPAAADSVNEATLTATLSAAEETLVQQPRGVAIARQAPAVPPAPPRPKAVPPASIINIQRATAPRPGRSMQRKRQQLLGMVLVLGLAAVAVGIGAYLLVRQSGDDRPVVSSLAPRGNAGSLKEPLQQLKTDKKQPTGGNGEIVAPGSNPDDTLVAKLPHSPSPAPPGPSSEGAADAEAQFREGEAALSRRNLDAAVKAFMKVAENPSAANREQAQNLLSQIATVTANDWARQQLAQLDNNGLLALAQRRMQFRFQGLHPELASVAHETLYRNLPEVMKSRGLDPPLGEAQQPPPPQPNQPQPPAVQPRQAGPTEPADMLRARGLKRVWKTWVHQDEARCMELLEAAKTAEKRHREADKELSSAKKKVDIAKRSLERDENAGKRAESTGNPASGTAEHEALTQRAAESRDAVAAAEEDFGRLKEESDRTEKEAADALSEARNLAAGLEEKYRQLADDPQVQEALSQLNQELGPSDEFKAMRGELNRGRAR